MKKIFAAVALAVIASAPAHATFKKAIDANIKYDTDIVIYSAEDCDYCTRADEFLDDFGVSHKLVYIDNDPVAAREMELFGGTSVPVMVVKGKVLQGFIKNHVYHTMVDVKLVDPKDHEK